LPWCEKDKKCARIYKYAVQTEHTVVEAAMIETIAMDRGSHSVKRGIFIIVAMEFYGTVTIMS